MFLNAVLILIIPNGFKVSSFKELHFYNSTRQEIVVWMFFDQINFLEHSEEEMLVISYCLLVY